MGRLRIALRGEQIGSLDLEDGREYQIGRNADCDVRLEAHPGISRVHFRIRRDGDSWIAETASKFASLSFAGSHEPTVRLEEGAAFQVGPYEFTFEGEEAIELRPTASDSAPPRSSGGGKPGAGLANFDGDDEATAVGALRLAPYIRYLKGQGGGPDELKLEGGPWLAGREEDADIFLNDPKASRKQFEIIQTSRGWQIKDLGSSNGTRLNGKVLPPNEPLPLRSGDVIAAQSIEMAFEARDVAFAQKAAQLPVVIPLVPYAYPTEPPPAALAYEPSARGGAVPYRPENRWLGSSSGRNNRTGPNKRILMIVGAIVVLSIAALISPGGAPPPKPATPEAAEIAKLSKAERQRLENSFRLAQEFWLQKNYEMALAQLEGIHRVLPKGYEGSLELKDRIDNAKRSIEEQDAMKRQREELQRLEAEAREIVARCRPLAASSGSPPEIRACLDRALQIKPDDQEALGLLEQVERRRAADSAKRASQAAYAASASQGRSLWAKAESLRKTGKRREAIGAYQAHVRSGYPDPEGLKAKSRASIAAIKQEMEAEIRAFAAQAQSALDRADYRSALEAAIKARAVDPDDDRAADIGARAKRELDAQLQAIYADAVVAENFGKLEEAKEKWRKILEMDRRGGDYWLKARSKLNTYGGR